MSTCQKCLSVLMLWHKLHSHETLVFNRLNQDVLVTKSPIVDFSCVIEQLNEMKILYFKVLRTFYLKPLITYLCRNQSSWFQIICLFYELVSDLAHNNQIHYFINNLEVLHNFVKRPELPDASGTNYSNKHVQKIRMAQK